jgi:hypothetical protein
MKYMSLLILVLLVRCSTPNLTKKYESTPIDSCAIVKLDTISNVFAVEKEQTEPNTSKTKEINVKSIIKKSKLKIIEIKNPYLKTTTNKGHVAYHIPTIMYVRDTYQVSLVISKTSVNIYEDFEGVVKTTTIPITETMEVKLIDPSPMDDKTFSIVPDNEAEQLIEDGNEVTKWTWNVTPLKSGGANLKIVVSIIKNGHKKETVYQDNIYIKTNPGKTIPIFIGKYWQWFLSTLIVPFGIWLYNKRKKDEKNN